MSMRWVVVGALFLLLGVWFVTGQNRQENEVSAEQGQRDVAVSKRVTPRLKQELGKQGLRLGAPVFIRIFKEERELELWVDKGERFELFRTYPIAGMSGKLGPKLAEGDRQAPEGFYFVPKSAMNPRSNYHLSFNIGYPNAFDRAHQRTGSFIMVHGGRQSIGCFAMTDAKIEEIYTLCDSAFDHGQKFFRVHVFPFRMTPERMKKAERNRWFGFWENLQEGYLWFERELSPPNVRVRDQKYFFEMNARK